MRRACSFVLLAALTQACTEWRPAPIAPSLAGEPQVRLTVEPGQRVLARRPTVSGDTLRDHTGVRLTFAEIRTAEVRRVDAMATTMLVVGVATALVVASVIAAQSIEYDLGF